MIPFLVLSACSTVPKDRTIVSDTTSQRRYGEFLHGVLDAEGGALWHCSQGKDRCGWGSAFVLAALGASHELFYGNVYRIRSGPAE